MENEISKVSLKSNFLEEQQHHWDHTKTKQHMPSVLMQYVFLYFHPSDFKITQGVGWVTEQPFHFPFFNHEVCQELLRFDSWISLVMHCLSIIFPPLLFLTPVVPKCKVVPTPFFCGGHFFPAPLVTAILDCTRVAPSKMAVLRTARRRVWLGHARVPLWVHHSTRGCHRAMSGNYYLRFIHFIIANLRVKRMDSISNLPHFIHFQTFSTTLGTISRSPVEPSQPWWWWAAEWDNSGRLPEGCSEAGASQGEEPRDIWRRKTGESTPSLLLISEALLLGQQP